MGSNPTPSATPDGAVSRRGGSGTTRRDPFRRLRPAPVGLTAADSCTSYAPGRPYADLLEPYRSVERQAHDDRPWVMANMVCGIDGSTAVDGRVGPLSTPTDAQLFLMMRELADVILVGASTVRQERYGRVQLDEEARARRVAAGRSPLPPIAVVSGSLAFDWDLPIFVDDDAGCRPGARSC